ncbi:hypothetical protein PB2503_00065 [Parvularcula bermudensis HTCC2503]|uniref:Uncharacterized protein n=1 Tax=Parvularcula bermudensis (strain ATCC BAA-594 / HTCC2503 / KCTC 12087) TaxID=314260 RepID=E0THX3_PARBH|nr:hypothetical protein PB2503_00065 [Parvularcula bermudensis HTCC2503]
MEGRFAVAPLTIMVMDGDNSLDKGE